MKKSLLLLLTAVAMTFGCKQHHEDRAALSVGRIDSVHSDVLKEERKIWVYVPESSAAERPEPLRYPVLYLLDGPDHFLAVTALVKQLAENSVCPEMIVVAIPNTDRSRDLTPTHSMEIPGEDAQDFLKTTGGGEAFTSFIEKELIPYVESHYPTAPHRILVGHSFGGLFAVNALIHHPQIFDSYIVIDPSMWWDRRKLLTQSDSAFKQATFARKTVFLGVANTMVKELDTARVNLDTAGASEHIRSILHLAKHARANPSNGLRFAWKYYNDDDHGSVPLISEYDGLRFIFNYYKPKPERADPKLADVKEHFRNVSERIGYPMLPPEGMINNSGYYLMQQKKWDEALAFFQFNIETYPKSQNVFDSMGDYYVAVGDTAKAIEALEKAQAIKDIPGTKEKLAALKK